MRKKSRASAGSSFSERIIYSKALLAGTNRARTLRGGSTGIDARFGGAGRTLGLGPAPERRHHMGSVPCRGGARAREIDIQ
jgi:hypothetical protein